MSKADQKEGEPEGAGDRNLSAEPNWDRLTRMLEEMESRMTARFDQVAGRLDDVERDCIRGRQEMGEKVLHIDLNVQACMARVVQVEGDINEGLGPQVDDTIQRVTAIEHKLDQMSRPSGQVNAEQQTATTTMSPVGQMNPQEYCAAVDNILRTRMDDSRRVNEDSMAESQLGRHARRRQAQRHQEELRSGVVSDRHAQDHRVRLPEADYHERDLRSAFWGQSHRHGYAPVSLDSGVRDPDPYRSRETAGYLRPGDQTTSNVPLGMQGSQSRNGPRGRDPSDTSRHRGEALFWQQRSRHRSQSMDSDSQGEDHRQDYTRSEGRFPSSRSERDRPSGARGRQDRERSSSYLGSRDSSESSCERSDRRSRHGGRSNSYATRSRASSEDSDAGFSQRRRRRRSPPLPKLPTFDGKPGEWKSFICQFRQRAKSSCWNSTEKLDRLMACLRGKAVDYVFNRPKDLRSDYYALKGMLTQRYNIAELPGTARRQLNSMRQEEQEALEDFADRVLVKVSEAYPNVEEEVAQCLGTESLLRGCRDKAAAYAASEHKPDTIYKALQNVKDAAANLRVFGRPAMTTRQVTFAEPEKETSTETGSRLTKEQERMLKFMTEMMSRMDSTTPRRSTSPSPDRGRGRSPSPCYNCQEKGHMARDCGKPRRCYNCNKTGHLANDCKEPRQRSGSPSPTRRSLEAAGDDSE